MDKEDLLCLEYKSCHYYQVFDQSLLTFNLYTAKHDYSRFIQFY